MKNLSYKTFIWTNILVLLLSQLAFLPGPKILYKPSVYFFGYLQLGSLILAPLLLLICFLWGCYMVFIKNRKWKGLFRHYLVLICSWFIIAFIATWILQSYSRQFSREFTIGQAQAVIQMIEQHAANYGQYPEKLEDLEGSISSPKIIGIKSWKYRRKNNSYTLQFSQVCPIAFWNFEIVCYDPLDQNKDKYSDLKWKKASDPYWRYYIYD